MSKPVRLLLAILLILLAIPWSDGARQDRAIPFHPPDGTHWLGTDGFGRDVLTRLVAGTRASLAAGLLATALALAVATALGALAGYYPGWRDEFAMRLAELFQSLPWLYLVLGIRSVLPLSLPPSLALLGIALVSGLTGWTRPARLVRGVVLSARTRDYVLAARAFGAGDLYLLRRHILPETFPVLAVQASVLLPRFILAEVTLSFLGLGIGEPAPSLGGMLSALRDLSVLSTYPWMLSPAVVLLLTLTGCNWLTRHSNR